MKWVLAIVMVLHGLIHSMGGINELGLAKLNGFSGKTLLSMPVTLKTTLGAGWFLAVILFILSAIMFLSGRSIWKPIAVFALIFSQLLIIVWWPDAKWGTIPNIIILIGIILL